MQLNTDKHNDILIIEAPNRIDALNASEFETAILELLEQHNGNVIIDLKNLEYVSSAGLRVFLVMAKTQEKKQHQLTLNAMQPFIKEIFEVTGFLNLFSLSESMAEATH